MMSFLHHKAPAHLQKMRTYSAVAQATLKTDAIDGYTFNPVFVSCRPRQSSSWVFPDLTMAKVSFDSESDSALPLLG